jgi:hypothetical protein
MAMCREPIEGQSLACLFLRGATGPGLRAIKAAPGAAERHGGSVLLADTQRLCTFLRVRLGDEPERVVIWDTVEVTVGRMPTQDLVVPDQDVSREHAVFRSKRGHHSVEDLGTTLGTRLNGERVETADLEPGDVVEIGRLRVEFHQTREALRSGGAVRFASELKGGAPRADDAGDRTVLGFVPDHELASAPQSSEVAAPSGPRALSAAGALEDIPDVGEDLGPGFEDIDRWRAAATPARDLDVELRGAGETGAADDPNATTRRDPTLQASASAARDVPAALDAHASLELTLEVRGPLAQLQGLLAALGDEEIRVGALRFRVRASRDR